MKLKIFNCLKTNFIVIFLVFILIACKNKPVEQNRPYFNKTGEELIRVNKLMIGKDVINIKAYIKRRNWKMKETESGLWYEIYKHGNGDLATKNLLATINFRVELLDGTYCYSSDSSGYKKFTIGTGKVESGLDEGIQLMRTGDAAHFILPPHLAYGLPGDNNRIPPRSIIVYDIELLNLEKKKD